MCHTPALSDLQAEYVAADRLTRSRPHHLQAGPRPRARHRLAARMRRAADRLDG